jgi:hypothetical protein
VIIIRGPKSLRGREARLHQFCNDWLSVDIPASNGFPADARMLSPTQVELTLDEMARIQRAYNEGTAGTLLDEFEPVPVGDDWFRLKKRGRRSRRAT